MLWIFLVQSLPGTHGNPQHEMTIALDRAPEPVSAYKPALPTPIEPQTRGAVAPPAIEITNTPRDQDLPPRPDPAQPNVQPSVALPGANATAGADRDLIVLLRAFVREDGTIGDVTLAGSCGVAALDDLAAAFVKAKWRFLPATENGRAVARWTTVEVLVRG
jgi:TonB family protein